MLMPELMEQNELAASTESSVEIQNVSFSYGSSQALRNITLELRKHEVTAFIGPSGCGKSTLLRCINRMNDEIPGTRVTEGHILVDGIDIHHSSVDVERANRSSRDRP